MTVKGDGGCYVLRGTLTEYTLGLDKTQAPTSRSRQVEFKSMAQPQDVDPDKKK